MTKENRRRTPTIELTPDLLDIFEKQYDEIRSLKVSFTAFVNSYLENYVKKQRLLGKLYPHLSVILADPDKGFFIKDQKTGVVVEIMVNLQDITSLLKCSIDKDKDICEHIEYALQSFELMQMLQASFISERTAEEDTTTTTTAEQKGKKSYVLT